MNTKVQEHKEEELRKRYKQTEKILLRTLTKHGETIAQQSERIKDLEAQLQQKPECVEGLVLANPLSATAGGVDLPPAKEIQDLQAEVAQLKKERDEATPSAPPMEQPANPKSAKTFCQACLPKFFEWKAYAENKAKTEVNKYIAKLKEELEHYKKLHN